APSPFAQSMVARHALSAIRLQRDELFHGLNDWVCRDVFLRVFRVDGSSLLHGSVADGLVRRGPDGIRCRLSKRGRRNIGAFSKETRWMADGTARDAGLIRRLAWQLAVTHDVLGGAGALRSVA